MNSSIAAPDLPFQDLVCEPAETIAGLLAATEEAVAQARRQRDPAALAAALIVLARLRFRLGQYPQAQALADEALTLVPPGAAERADVWQILANCAAECESPTTAESYYRMAADLARETGHFRAQAAALHGLAAAIYLPRGRFDLALAADAEVRRLALEHKQSDWLVYPLIGIALAHQMAGQRAQAQAALAELAPLAPAGSVVLGYYLCLSAELAFDAGEPETGRHLLMQARSIAEASGEPWLNCAVRLGMSRYHRLLGAGPEARAWADDALTIARRLGRRYDEGRALLERGRGAWLCGNEAAATADLQAAAEILTRLDAAFDLARARFLLAALHHAAHDPAAADAWLAAARAINEGGYAFLLEQERALSFPLLAAYQFSPCADLARANALLLEQLRRVPPLPLHIVTLGRFAVWQGGRLVEAQCLRQRRAGELLALLLLSPDRRLAVEQATEALTPDRDFPAAQTHFHHATSALRRALEPDLPAKFPSRYLTVEEGQVILTLPAGSWLDLEAFELHCRRAEWEEALALYAGELLPDYRYADWTFVRRERLALLHQKALWRAAEGRLADGQPAEALDACRRLLALEPWHEAAVLLGMRACAALGDLAGARRLYRNLAATLRAELNTDPQAELQAYYHALTPATQRKQ